MWPAVIPLLVACLLLTTGMRGVWRDVGDRRFVWGVLGAIATALGAVAFVLVANLYAGAAART